MVDSFGTVLTTMLGGPIVGALSGVINNIIYGLTLNPVSYAYAVTSLFIGLIVDVLSEVPGHLSKFLKRLL